MPNIFERLGVRTIINAKGPATRVSGGIMPPEAAAAMQEASQHCVDMTELQARASEIIAEATGAEAGYVTSGAAAGLLLGAAACVTGLDPDKMNRLPDTRGMKSRVIVPRSHRNFYDHAVRAVGVELVEVGIPDRFSGAGVRDTEAWEIAAAIDEDTAAILYVANERARPSLRAVAEVAHAAGVPVLVDAAAEVPPIENLTRFMKMGVDMVAYSGGKGIGGPQNAGLLAGRKDLMDAAFLHMFNLGSGTVGIGRPCKVPKETVVGMVTALELFLESDHVATWAGWARQAEYVVDRLSGIPGLRVVVEDGDPNRQGPQAVIYSGRNWTGPSFSEVRKRLADGKPSIRVGGGGYRDEINIVMVNVQQGEERIIADRLEEILRH